MAGNPPAYPHPEEIATAWGRDGNNHVSYFRNNRIHSIQTFQDSLILDYLRTNYREKAAGIS
jgi:hypothetical protein